MNVPFTRYSPERRTALVLCGTGAHGAYHAGVLRAIEEAGVKIDIVAGHGIGAAGAALAAIGGAARLWEKDGVWRGGAARRFYAWTRPVRALAWLLPLSGALVLALPLLLTGGGRSPAGAWVWVPPVLALACVLAVAVGDRIRGRRAGAARRTVGGSWWRIVGAPVNAESARDTFAGVLWQLIRVASHLGRPPDRALGRRYAEVLAESLGQPGFRELMLVATDLDARRDIVAGLLAEPYRREFTATRGEPDHSGEIVDLAGAGRELAFQFVAAALTPPMVCDPYLLPFDVESYWRGETHRLCDRPGACSRLLDELANAGVSQVIVASAVAAPGAPHRLTAPRLELRHRLGEFLAASEAAALRDALELARLRFDSVHVIRPVHNAVGPFDAKGAYDEASDRRQEPAELMERAYEDAYRQFIEPVVGASGDQLARIEST